MDPNGNVAAVGLEDGSTFGKYFWQKNVPKMLANVLLREINFMISFTFFLVVQGVND